MTLPELDAAAVAMVNNYFTARAVMRGVLIAIGVTMIYALFTGLYAWLIIAPFIAYRLNRGLPARPPPEIMTRVESLKNPAN